MGAQQERTSIGLTTIWNEGQGVERPSMSALLAHVLRRAYENIARSPVTATLTTVTIAIALFLLGVFVLVVRNCAIAVSQESGDVMINVFLKDAVSADDVQMITKQLAPVLGDLPVVYTDKLKALESFKAMLGDDAAILEGLDADNPLPPSLDIKLGKPEEAERLYQALSEKLAGDGRIESIRYSRGVIQQLRRILKIVELGGLVGVLFILGITGFIIANTIKLALYTHRMEVEIMQLVGARRGAIYAPYVLEGLLQGLVGAIVGLLLVFSVFLFVRDALFRTDLLQFLFPQFQFLSVWASAWILIAGGIVGMTGSFLAVRRFLATED
jgi:cell division transport system permease protein